MPELNTVQRQLIDLIEAARVNGQLSNSQANSASACLVLDGDDSDLANRVVAQGADPFALEYLLHGEVSDKVRAAHYAGPGVYARNDPDRWHYLTLVALSHDESKGTTLIERVTGIAQSLCDLGGLDASIEEDRVTYLKEIGEAEDERIMETPTIRYTLGGVEMQIGISDRVFAKAYWSGEKCAGVYHVHPVQGAGVLVGCDGETLEGLGIITDKVIKPDLGVTTDPDVLEDIKLALLEAGILDLGTFKDGIEA